jgi:hypothetical protein
MGYTGHEIRNNRFIGLLFKIETIICPIFIIPKKDVYKWDDDLPGITE